MTLRVIQNLSVYMTLSLGEIDGWLSQKISIVRFVHFLQSHLSTFNVKRQKNINYEETWEAFSHCYPSSFHVFKIIVNENLVLFLLQRGHSKSTFVEGRGEGFIEKRTKAKRGMGCSNICVRSGEVLQLFFSFSYWL